MESILEEAKSEFENATNTNNIRENLESILGSIKDSIIYSYKNNFFYISIRTSKGLFIIYTYFYFLYDEIVRTFNPLSTNWSDHENMIAEGKISKIDFFIDSDEEIVLEFTQLTLEDPRNSIEYVDDKIKYIMEFGKSKDIPILFGKILKVNVSKVEEYKFYITLTTEIGLLFTYILSFEKKIYYSFCFSKNWCEHIILIRVSGYRNLEIKKYEVSVALW